MKKPESNAGDCDPSPAVENYLKATLRLCLDHNCESVSTGQLSKALHVSPATVSSMLRTLVERGHIQHKPYEGIRLTESGRALATGILRRHRLMELFLVRMLKLTWDQVHAEAERMEHAASNLVIDRIDELLGFPTVDPHGDPIPDKDGGMRAEQSSALTLDTCGRGTQVRIIRVINQEPGFLRYLSVGGLVVGVAATVESNHDVAAVVTLQIENHHLSLGLDAAAKVLVRVEEREPIK